ncbi:MULTISPECIES: DUF6461 domain-containing protein [Actinomycetes]|uniref:DUF6461 domain-containing protein n=1 Tax=Actinomycetes TaxID=1760 RepID=UPI000525A3E3|nr:MULTISPECIES: DUF6461 domain-containing protein [Actinomycetes]
MANVTYGDYRWTQTAPDLFNAFCLTYISEATVEQVVDALPTVGSPQQWNLATLASRSMESWGEIRDNNLLVGLIQHGGWTVMYEHNGYIGAKRELMQPLSVGREVVVHHGSEHSYFFRYVDGVDRTWFETLYPSRRQGSAPDELVPIMRQIGGFELEPDESVKVTEFHHHEATFALCDAVTGLRLTPPLLRQATFAVVEVVNRPGTPAAAERPRASMAYEHHRRVDQGIRDWARRQGHNLP